MAASPTTSTDFIDLVRKSGVVPTSTLDSLDNLPAEPTACAAALIAKGHITKFQAKLLLNGRYKGFKLGHYVVREQIGQGGMGAVYLAEHETLRRKVGLKVLTAPKDSKDGQLALERFLREARSAAALDHPNIVRLHDVGQHAGTHYLVMEYVDGQTLEELLSKAGPISPSRAVGYIAQAAAGLQHAYDKGFVHRDIKPGNLILTKDGTIKILDMGLARPTDNSADNKVTEILDKGAVVGTADFISPEQAMNAKIDIRSDIYSLGATFFSLVTGAPPFSGSTTQKLLQHQLKEAPSLTTLDKTFPNGLSRVVAKMLEKKPDNRYQSPSEVIQALAEWLPEEGSRKVKAGLSGAASAELENTLSEIKSSTERIGSSTRLALRKKQQQRRMMLWGGGAAAVLLVGALIGYLASGSSKPTTVVQQPPPPAVVEKPPKVEPKPTPKNPKPTTSPTSVAQPPIPKLTQGTLVLMPLEHMVPFSQALSSYMDGSVRRLRVIDEVGPGLPRPWYRWIENLGGEAEICFEQSADGNVFSMRGTSGPGGFMVTSPDFKCPTGGKVIITVTYLTEAESPGGAIRFRQTEPTERTSTVLPLPPTKGKWETITQEVDLKDAAKGLFELSTPGVGPNTAVKFKQFEVTIPK